MKLERLTSKEFYKLMGIEIPKKKYSLSEDLSKTLKKLNWLTENIREQIWEGRVERGLIGVLMGFQILSLMQDLKVIWEFVGGTTNFQEGGMDETHRLPNGYEETHQDQINEKKS